MEEVPLLAIASVWDTVVPELAGWLEASWAVEIDETKVLERLVAAAASDELTLDDTDG